VDERARQTLREIEEDLRRGDPAFAARMSGERPCFPTVSALCACVYVVIPLMSLLFGLFAVLLTLNAATAVIVAVLIRRRSRIGMVKRTPTSGAQPATREEDER